MTTCQREVAAIMIEVSVVPVGGIMACGTVTAILTLMFVILPVTGIAVLGCTLKDSIHVTGFTRHFGMFPNKLK